MNSTDTAPQMRDIIAAVLSVDEEEVTPTARFFADLGAESIDVLDLSFQVERQFGVKIEFSRLLAGDQIQTDEHGVVTPESLQWLAEKYPFLGVEQLGPSPTPEAMKDLLTVEAITRLVDAERNAAPGGQRPASSAL
jgi:acyl carrier protein